MKIYLFLFLSLQTLLFGCATCTLMTPSVEMDITLKMEQKRLKSIHFLWHFSDMYTEEVTRQFDKNSNDMLDEDELKDMQKSMLEYLAPKKMLTSIQYADINASEASKLEVSYSGFHLRVQDEFLLFSYDATLNQEISPDASLSMAFEDDESFFAFIMSRLEIEGGTLSYTKNLYLFTASILFLENPPLEDVLQEPKEAPSKPDIQKTSSIQESYLQAALGKIKELFSSIRDEHNPLTYLTLLLFAFGYGLIHAMGPGHGKTLVGSYFLANDRSYAKALFISLAIGIVHTFSAFILTLLIYFVLTTLMAQLFDDALFYTTKIAALIIIAIAAYLLYKKWQFYQLEKVRVNKITPKFTITPPHISSCGCSACKVDKNSTDFALIISAGIVPCPGTTTIFIFALSLKLYFAGFIAALVMSLGMSSIIFVSALLSTLIRKKASQKSQKLQKYLEYGSLGFIFILGGILLLS